MAIKTKRPPMKETVGAQYLCFNTMDTDGRWTSTFAEEVEKTEVVKSVKVTENGEASDTYASGTVYDSDISTTSTDIEVEVVAFPADTLAKLRGDNVDADGLILSGGNRPRPYFAYGKVVKLRKGGYRYDWYPKCKLSENSELTKKAPIASPSFTGTPKVPTASAGTNNTQAASTAFVTSAISTAMAGITKLDFQVVQTLPSTGVKGTFYLIANSGRGQNVYDEYLWINNKYEKLGTREIDLSSYIKQSDMVAITNSEIDAAFA